MPTRADLEWDERSDPEISIGAHAGVGKPGLDNPSVLAYASTKGALETLVKNWAGILGPRGIRVTQSRQE